MNRKRRDLAPFRLPTTPPVSPYQQGGRLLSDWVAAFDRNRWPPSVGIGGRFASDSAGRIRAMQQRLHRSSLVPRGFVVESACYEGDKAAITVRASTSVGLCPSSGTVSRRIRSRYRRRVTDLPWTLSSITWVSRLRLTGSGLCKTADAASKQAHAPACRMDRARPHQPRCRFIASSFGQDHAASATVPATPGCRSLSPDGADACYLPGEGPDRCFLPT